MWCQYCHRSKGGGHIEDMKDPNENLNQEALRYPMTPPPGTSSFFECKNVCKKRGEGPGTKKFLERVGTLSAFT